MEAIPRLQTAEHILCKILEDRFKVRPGICKFEPDRGLLEVLCEWDDLRKINLKEIADKVNEIVKQDLPLKKYVLPREESEKVVSLWKVPETAIEIRVVEIEGFDKRPCRDEHVEHTGQVGQFDITKVERVGKDRYRFLFKVVEN